MLGQLVWLVFIKKTLKNTEKSGKYIQDFQFPNKYATYKRQRQDLIS